tara:strand:- start:903 stop:1145 length:243 start_codon:yes stop_codon:yes gene_type:complete
MSYSIQIGNGNSVSYNDLSESQVSELRAKRNAKLAETDIYMVSDFPITTEQKNAWQTYRQALRDMDFSDLDNITWPTKPE